MYKLHASLFSLLLKIPVLIPESHSRYSSSCSQMVIKYGLGCRGGHGDEGNLSHHNDGLEIDEAN